MISVGAAVFAADVCKSMSASRVDNVEISVLAYIRGGSTFWCGTVEHDVDAVDCDECTSNGNGGSVKCIDPGEAQTHSDYIIGQNPRMRVECHDSECPGYGTSNSAKEWITSGNCDYADWNFFYTTCLRKYDVCTAIPTPGGNCPAP